MTKKATFVLFLTHKMLCIVPIATSSIFMTGCMATFSDHSVRRINTFPPVTQRPSVLIENCQLQIITRDSGVQIVPNKEASEAVLRNKMEQRFQKSGLFSKVSVFDKESDITLNGHVRLENDASFGKIFLSTITLWLIPVHSRDVVQMSIHVKDNRTGFSKTLELEETADTWIHLLLLPVTPFYFPPSEKEKIIDNLMDNLAIRVQEALTPQQPTVASPVAIPATVILPKEIEQATAAPKADIDVLAKLKILKDAKEAGLVTPAEYEQKRADLLKQL